MMGPDFNRQLLLYYQESFPHELICTWLRYKDSKSTGGPNCFYFREFSFTLPGDIYIRYQAFKNESEFYRSLTNRVPIKLDIGAVYNRNPDSYKANPNDFRPLQHELVFDIDISDYNDVRTCCKESDICSKCWPFMRIGAKILNTILTEEFGFKHILFVFSGRRGFHCWVCDKIARDLTPDARRAITEYFSVVTGGQAMVKRVTLNPYSVHPMITKSLQIIEKEFEELMLDNQDFLGTSDLVQSIIDICEDFDLQKRISDECKHKSLTSRACWEKIKLLTGRQKSKKSKYFIEEVMLQHCYPRLDVHVTKGINHLLKSPFCIHPKTGKVCVPMDIDQIDNFDIDKVPKLADLPDRKLMDPYIKVMKKFVDGFDTRK